MFLVVCILFNSLHILHSFSSQFVTLPSCKSVLISQYRFFQSGYFLALGKEASILALRALRGEAPRLVIPEGCAFTILWCSKCVFSLPGLPVGAPPGTVGVLTYSSLQNGSAGSQ